MREIDPAGWPHKEIYDFYGGLSNPFFGVTFRLDVTELYAYVKRKGISFYKSLTYLVTKAVNENEKFLYTVRDGRLYLLEERFPSFTDVREGDSNFHIVTMPCRGTMEEFCREADKANAEQDCFIDMEKEGDGLIYISSLPWIDITSVTNPRNLTDPMLKEDSTPSIAWGKFVEQNGRKVLGMSIEANHRFVDGRDIGYFAARLEELIENLSD